MLTISEYFAPFEEVCVQRGFRADVGLAAVDECGWMFSLITFGWAPDEGSFDIFATGFWLLAMLEWDWSGQKL